MVSERPFRSFYNQISADISCCFYQPETAVYKTFRRDLPHILSNVLCALVLCPA